MDGMNRRDNIRAPERSRLLSRLGQLKSERASYIPHWQDITRTMLTRNGRYFQQDRNRGERSYNRIVDNTGTRSLRILGAGLMAGSTSPAKPWFRLGTPDPSLNDFQSVRLWTSDVTRVMQLIFQKSNTYRALHQMYEEVGGFGTAASIMLSDYDSVIHHYPSTVGEFCLAADYRGRICTIYREFDKTVGELVKEFGYNNVSTHVKNQYDRGNLDIWISIIHAVEPRMDRDPSKKDNKNMPWGSYYFELNGDSEKYLRESGFKHFPALTPRWASVGGDIYGSYCPGMESLGSVMALQHLHLRKAEAIDYETKPPLQVPTSLINREVERLPGGITFTDTQSKITSMFEVNLNLQHLLMDIQDTRQRVRGAFYEDLFLMVANSTDTNKTATEVAELHEEKMLMLGPVMERLHNELLSPLIENTFTYMIESNLVPPAPQELQGQELNVEFISVLAQAQRAIGTNSTDRFVGNLGMVAKYKPDVLDKFNSDEWVDSYSDMLGVDPKIIVSNKDVAMIRQQRAQAQAAQAQTEAMRTNSETARNLGSVQTDGGSNALMDIMNQYSGYSSPSPTQV